MGQQAFNGHYSPDQNPELQPNHQMPSAKIFDFQTGAVLQNPEFFHPNDVQPTIYDWAKEGASGTGSKVPRYVGSFPSLEHADTGDTHPLNDKDRFRNLGNFVRSRVDNGLDRLADTTGLVYAPKPQTVWEPGKNQLDYLPHGITRTK